MDVGPVDYLDGFQYKGGRLQFFPTSEGYVRVSDLGGVYIYSYVYNYTDHLGNIRVSYARDPQSPNGLKILEENHYYPFGLKHTNYNSDVLVHREDMGALKIKDPDFPKPAVPILPYNYKYNGKEWQEELGLNIYDYGARNYDPAIGRWLNVDNMAEKHYTHSPYNYALNNPVNVIDPDGNDVIFILMSSNEGVGGHADIAISNYKKDKDRTYIKDEKGNYIEDGTYTYYSFAPSSSSGISEKNYKESVEGEVSISKNVTMEDIMNSTPNIADNNKVVIGVLKVDTNKAYDDKVKKDFEDANKGENKVYNLITNNCTTFTSRAFTNKSLGKESLTTADGKKVSLYTENKMFRDLSKQGDVNILLNPGKRVNESIQSRYNKFYNNLPWLTQIKM